MDERKKFSRTLYGIVERNASIVPERKAVQFGDLDLTWRELHENINRFARALVDLGVRPGENVGVMLRNCNQFVEAFIAAPHVRARPFNVNYRYKSGELTYVLSNAEAALLVVHPEYEDLVEEVRGQVPTLRHVVVCGTSARGNLEWDDLTAGYGGHAFEPPRGRGDSRGEILFYTGGTTGMPKGVLWPQENIMLMISNNVTNALVKNMGLLARVSDEANRRLVEMLGLPLSGHETARSLYGRLLGSERVGRLAAWLAERAVFVPPGVGPLIEKLGRSFKLLIGSPLMHGAAWVAAEPALAVAGTVYLLPDSDRFEPRALWKMVERERITMVLMVGDAFAIPMLEALEAEDYDLESLAVLATGAVKLSPHLKERFHRLLPDVLIVDSLLATEGGGAVSEASTSRSVGSSHRFKVNSSGRFPVMVVDENGEFVEPGSGKVGRLAYGGPQSVGYWKDPKKTARCYLQIDGKNWLVVGDMCTVEKDGTVNLIGRDKACINSGGEKIYPYEIENLLMESPLVKDVVVLGVPHPRWGEAVAAVVEPSSPTAVREETSRELEAFVRGRLADFKCPKHWVLVESMGRSPSGKIYYESLRDVAIERLGLKGKPRGSHPTGNPAEREKVAGR